MFEKVIGIIFLITVMLGGIAGLAIVASPVATPDIEAHDMGNGIVCFTFNSDIDCLQVAE